MISGNRFLRRRERKAFDKGGGVREDLREVRMRILDIARVNR